MNLARWPLPLRFGVSLLAVLALSLGAFYWSMHPPLGDLSLMALFLGLTAAISGLAGAVAYRFGWLEHMPSVHLSLLGGYALASLLTFFNVWVTARLMFASVHDLQLATVLLVFAAGIAMGLGYFLSSGITRRIQAVQQAAQRLAQGDLTTRAPCEGRDEVATLAGSFNDMAARLQAAAQQQKELDALRRDLVAWVSHDLQTPLAAMRVQIEALADGMVDDPATTQRYLRSTQRQINELSHLIDDLFQMAQLDAGGLPLQRTPCALADLLSDTLESFSALAQERGVQLHGQATAGLDPVTLDAPRLGRVLNNLVGNAVRHTPAGGQVSLQAWRAGAEVIVEVRDTGEGIAPADLPQVFERFYRGEKSRNRGTGGAGLGLAIARGLARAHGGDLTVQSAPGQGATFRLTLPG